MFVFWWLLAAIGILRFPGAALSNMLANRVSIWREVHFWRCVGDIFPSPAVHVSLPLLCD